MVIGSKHTSDETSKRRGRISLPLQSDSDDNYPNDTVDDEHSEDENENLIGKYSPNILRPLEFIVEHMKKLEACISDLGYLSPSIPITCDEDLLNYCNRKSSHQHAAVGTFPSPLFDEHLDIMPQLTTPSVLAVFLSATPIRGKLLECIASKMKRHQSPYHIRQVAFERQWGVYSM